GALPAHKRAAVAIGGPSGNTGIANAPAVIAGMAPAFRRCYNLALTRDPDLKGTLRVTAKIGPGGEVLATPVTGGTTLSPELIACIQARITAAQFAPPDGGNGVLVIPISFFTE
ncbi:MAG: AgmX/PglI C-terminal domain-containing protein, partial [Polyangiaceae bacterium]